MQILVTGATGVFGRSLCERLTARGDRVVAMARRKPAVPVDAAEFRVADVRDAAAVAEAMAGCDAVAHLAWTLVPLATREQTEDLDVGGTRNVLAAMASTGCRRIVFASSVNAYGTVPRGGELLTEDAPRRPPANHLYGTHKKMAEDLLFSAPVDAVVVRGAVTAGRAGHGNTVFTFLSGPSLIDASDGDGALQLTHPDDVGRFFAHALHADRTGPVNLAAADVVSSAEMARLLGRPLVRMPSSALARGIRAGRRLGWIDFAEAEAAAIAFMPKVDTTSLARDWDFTCAWSTAETARDVGRGVAGRIALLERGEIVVPGSLPLPRVTAPTGTSLADACDVRIAAADVRAARRAEVRRLGAALVGESTAPSGARRLSDAELGVRISLAADRLIQASTAGSDPVPPTRALLSRERAQAVALPTTPAGLLDRAATTLQTLLAEAAHRLGTTTGAVLELSCSDLVERLERRGARTVDDERIRSERAV